LIVTERFMESLQIIVFGFIVALIALPIVAITRAGELARRIDALNLEIAQLRRIVYGHIEASTQQADQPQQAPPLEPAPPAQPLREDILMRLHQDISANQPPSEPEPEPVRPLEPSPRPAPQPAAQPARADSPLPPKSRTLAEWEMLIGGNIVNRIAAIGLIIVTAFFLKYAYDHHWITSAMIVTIGFICGAVLLYVGSRFHHSGAQIFAQGLLGGGISVLYLSGYAIFSYHLVSQLIAFTIMAAVTVIAFLQARRYDSLVVSLLGLAGGFLTPMLVSSGAPGAGANHLGLFAYIALLDLGLLAMAVEKDSWAVLEPLALACTYITYLVWHGAYYDKTLVTLTIPFLTIIWLPF